MDESKSKELGIRSSAEEFLVFSVQSGGDDINVRYEDETLWLTQKAMSVLFDVSVPTVNEHLASIFTSGELEKEPTIRKFRIVQMEDNREVTREIEHYNLDVIISIGYRVNSMRATQFRRWATKILRKYAIEGYIVDRRNKVKKIKYYIKMLKKALFLNDNDKIEDNAKKKKVSIKILGIIISIIITIFTVIFEAEIVSYYENSKLGAYFKNVRLKMQSNNMEIDDYINNADLCLENYDYYGAIQIYDTIINKYEEKEDILNIAYLNAKKGYAYLQLCDLYNSSIYIDKALINSKLIEPNEENFIKIININNISAEKEILTDNYIEAFNLYKKNEKIFNKFNDIKSISSINNNLKIAEVCYLLLNNNEAQEYINKSESIILNNYENNSLMAGNLYNIISIIYMNIDYNKSLEYANRAYEIFYKNSPDYPKELAKACNTLGQLYDLSDKNIEARIKFEEEKENYNYLGYDNYNYYVLLNRINLLKYSEDNKYKKNELEDILNKTKYKYEDNNVLSAKIMINLGDMYYEMYEYIDSSDCYKEAIEIYNKINDRKYNINVAYSNYCLAKLEFYINNNNIKSLKYLDDALKIFAEKNYQENILYVADCWILYGDIHVYTQESPRWFLAAEGCYKKSLETYEKISNKVKSADCYIKMAKLYAVDNDKKNARENLVIAKKYYKDIYGENNFSLIKFYLDYASIEYDLKNYNDAIAVCDNAMQIYKRLDIEHPIITKIYASLAKYYYYNGQYKESEINANWVIEWHLEYQEQILYEYIIALRYTILDEIASNKKISNYLIDELVKTLEYTRYEKDDLFTYYVLAHAYIKLDNMVEANTNAEKAWELVQKYYRENSHEYKHVDKLMNTLSAD